MDFDAAVVGDEPQFSKSIHEKTHAGPGRSDHLRKRLLADFRDYRLRLAFLPKVRQQQEHPREGRRALQMGNAMPLDLRCNREALPGVRDASGIGLRVRLRADLIQVRQARQDSLGRHAEIQQAGDLVDTRALAALHHPCAGRRRAEKPAGLEVALKREIENGVDLALRQAAQVYVFRLLGAAAGPLESGERPGEIQHQLDRAAQVFLHRPANQLAHGVVVLAYERVQHERHPAGGRVVACSRPCLAVDGDFSGHFVDRLTQQVSEDIRAKLAGLAIRVGIARGGDPERQLSLYWTRKGFDRYVLPERIAERNFLAPPQAFDLVDVLQHHALVVGVVLGAQDKIVGLPAGGEGERHPAVAEVVDDGPFLGDTDRMVQGRNAAAGADTDALGDGRERGAGDGWIRIRAAESVKMALRRPHGLEAVAIEILRPFQHQTVLVASRRVIVAPHEQAEAQREALELRRRRKMVLHVALDDDFEAARQSPEQLEHGDIEREARHGKPGTGRIVVYARVHGGEEVHQIAVLHHHAFGSPGRTRGVHDVGEVCGSRRRGGIGARQCRIGEQSIVD